MAEDTLLQTHPHLAGVLLSRHPWLTLRTVVPLSLIFAWLIAASPVPVSPGSSALGLATGAAYWSFFEYAMHRWIYHPRFRKRKVRWIVETFHLHHHRDLADRRVINAGPLMAIPVATMIFFPLAWLIPGHVIGWIGIGFMATYHAYEWIHYGIHLRRFERGYMAYIQRYHLYHHDLAWDRNYGNTSALWDRVFGTYDAKSRDYRLTPAIEATLYANQPPPIVSGRD